MALHTDEMCHVSPGTFNVLILCVLWGRAENKHFNRFSIFYICKCWQQARCITRAAQDAKCCQTLAE